jgi:hypothetical protein
MKKLKLITGFLILPIFTALFVLDRIILTACWWITSIPIQTWIYDENHAYKSLIRVIVALSIYGLFELIF